MIIKEIIIPNAYKLQEDPSGNYKSIIIDQELDPFHIDLDGEGSVKIDTGEMANIILSINDLKDLIKLIRRADKLTQKKLEL